MTTTDENPAPLDIGEVLAQLEALAKANPDQPKALAEGTFAMYPMPDGGVMFVVACPDGPMQGVHHHRMPAPLLRAIATLVGGGGKMKALKGMFGGRKKEIEGGR